MNIGATMKKTRLGIFAIVVALAVVAGCSKTNKINTASEATPAATPPAAGTVEMKLKWAPGERIIQEMGIKQNVETAIPGLSAPVKTDVTIDQKISLTVVSTDPDGGHQLELQFLSIRLDGESAGKKMAFDSDKDKDPETTDPVARAMGIIVGARLQYFLDAGNKVVRIEGVDDLLNRFSGSDSATASIKSMFTQDYFKRMLDPMLLYLPPKAVRPGDSWPVTIELPMGTFGTMNMDYTSTFKGWDMRGKRNCALIEFVGKVGIQPNTSTSQRITLSVHDGKASGMVWFDPEFGSVIDSEFNKDMTLLFISTKSSRDNPGATPETQTITNQMTQTVNFKVVSLN